MKVHRPVFDSTVQELQSFSSAAGCTQDQKGQWSCDEQPLEFQLDVVNGWTDWIRTAQLIKQDLKALGVRVKVKTLDYGAWFGRLQRGEFELAIGWSMRM